MRHLALAFFLAFAISTAAAESPDFLPKQEFLDNWKVSKQFTLDVAEKMPAEHYSFKPAPEQMSFGEQMIHVAGSLYHRFAQLRGAKSPSFEKAPDPVDKAAVLKLVAGAFDYAADTLTNLTPEIINRPFDVKWKGRPEVNGRQMMLNMLVHAAHHRAQCEVYLRLKGISPPEYTF